MPDASLSTVRIELTTLQNASTCSHPRDAQTMSPSNDGSCALAATYRRADRNHVVLLLVLRRGDARPRRVRLFPVEKHPAIPRRAHEGMIMSVRENEGDAGATTRRTRCDAVCE